MTTPEQLGSPHPNQAIVPLAEAEREAFPQIIYQEISDRADGHQILLATVAAATRHGLGVVVDLDTDENGLKSAVVRTAAEDQRQQRTEGALILGVSRAIGLGIEAQAQQAEFDQASYAYQTAEALTSQMVDHEGLRDTFAEYYGGLRWSTDQERFVQDLFTYSAEYDPEVVKSFMTPVRLTSFVYRLDVDIPYDEQRSWEELDSVEEIFAAHPELDYRRLETDPEFAASPAGQQLKQKCTEAIGEAEAQRYKEHRDPLRPLIPLTKFPVIEALMIDEVGLSKPEAKYSFTPKEVSDLIVNSDSQPAIEAYVQSIIQRLPEEARHVFDGPNEFEHKHGQVLTLGWAYERTGIVEHKEILKHQLLTVLAAFTDGPIAQSVLQERRYNEEQGFSFPDFGTHHVDKIIETILIFGLASPDADEFLSDQVSLIERGLNITGATDSLHLSTAAMQRVVLEALKKIGPDSQPEIFEKLASKLFQSADIGQQIRQVVEQIILSAKMFQAPEVTLARAGLKKVLYKPNDSPEALETRQKFDEVTAEADLTSLHAKEALNNTLKDYIVNLLDNRQAGVPEPAGLNIEVLLNYIDLGSSYNMTSLPEIYHELLALGEHSAMTIQEKATITWKIHSLLEHAYGDAAKLVPKAILDIYKLMLGPADELRLPESDTGHGLAAASYLANRSGIFEFADEDTLLTLERYKMGLAAMLQQITNGILPLHVLESENDEQIDSWQADMIKNIGGIVRSMKQLEDSYTEFLHIGEVKAYAHVYYPWILEKLTPFWHKMKWEVSPGNRPNADIRKLQGMLQDHINSKLVLKREGEFTEDFDYFGEGHLDSLLLECFHQMVVPYDIKHNTTVWQDGLTFMHYAVNYMPKSVVERFEKEYGQTEPDFVKYLKRERSR